MAASVGTSSKSISGFDPRSLSGCVLWLDADDPYTLFSDAGGTTLATTTVNAWKDKSTNALLFTGGTSGPTLTKSTTVNSRPYLSFNGTSNYLLNTSMSVSQPYTIYVVAYLLGNTNNYYRLLTGLSAIGSNGNLVVGSQVGNFAVFTGNGTNFNDTSAITPLTSVYTVWAIYSATVTGATVNSFLNGVALNSKTGTYIASTLTGFNIAGGNSLTGFAGVSGQFFVGNIGEILMYNYVLSASQRQQVEGYLAWKWGMTSSSTTKPTAITLPVSHSFYISKPHSRKFSPLDIPGCALWLDAADKSTFTLSSGNITTWTDKSSTANNFTTTAGTATNITDGGYSVVSFPSETIMTSTSTLTWTTSSAFFVVSKIISIPSRQYADYIIGFSSIINADFSIRVEPLGLCGTPAPTIPPNVNDLSIYNYYVNGSLNPNFPLSTYQSYNIIHTGNPSQAGTSVMTLSTIQGRYLVGNIAEVLYYPGGVTSIQRQQIESYLAWKWGITLATTSQPTFVTTFAYNGTIQSWLCPTGVTSVTVYIWGAGGGGAYPNKGVSGGAGAFVTGTWTTTPGTTYYIAVGAGGIAATGTNTGVAGGWPGGGSSGTYGSAGGGGYSGIFTTSATPSQANAVVIAGGGGGAGVDEGADWGGSASFKGTSQTGGYNGNGANAGGGATTTAGGTGGTGSGYTNGTAGSALTGGTGGGYGAGGGGGYWGGGGGSYYSGVGGGGGGSSYSGGLTNPTGITSLNATGNTAITAPGSSYQYYINGVAASSAGQNGGNGLVVIVSASNQYSLYPPLSSLPFYPTHISGCLLWLDGNDKSTYATTVTTWTDKSGNGNTATTSEGTVTTSTTGLVFSGSQAMTIPGIAGSLVNTPFVIFVVETVGATEGFFFADNTENGGIDRTLHIGYRSLTNHTFAFYTDDLENNTVSGSGSMRLWCFYLPISSNRVTRRNGVVDVTHSNYNRLKNFTSPVIGRRWSGNYYNGTISEVLVYRLDIGLPSIQQIEGYLAAKWGIALPSTHTYFKFQPSQLAPPVSSTFSSSFTPGGVITGVKVWLDASDPTTLYSDQGTTLATIGGPVAYWRDKSGSANHYTQTTAANQPIYSNLGGVLFPATNIYSFLGNSSVWAGTNSYDIFCVSKPHSSTATGSWRTLMRGSGNDHIVIIQTGDTQLGYYKNVSGGFQQFGSLRMDGSARTLLYVSISAANAYTASINGTIALTTATIAGNNDNFQYLGNYQGGGQPWGEINELMIVPTCTNAQRQTIEGYLAAKWGLQTSLPVAQPYYTFSPTPMITIAGTTLTATWASSPDVSSYTVNLYSQSTVGGDLTLVKSTVQTAISFGYFPLTTNLIYTVYVSVIDSAGISSVPAVSNSVPCLSTPSITSVSISGTTLTASATAQLGATISYLISPAVTQISSSSGTFTGITSATAYTVTAIVSAKGVTSISQTASITSLATPTFTASISGTTFTSTPSTSGASAYSVSLYSGTSGSGTLVTTNTTGTFTGLTAGTAYYVTAYATATNLQSITATLATSINCLATPTMNTVTVYYLSALANSLSGAMTLSWGAITNATSYTVFSSTDGTSYTSQGAQTSPYYFTPTNAQRYWFRIVASGTNTTSFNSASVGAAVFSYTTTVYTFTPPTTSTTLYIVGASGGSSTVSNGTTYFASGISFKGILAQSGQYIMSFGQSGYQCTNNANGGGAGCSSIYVGKYNTIIAGGGGGNTTGTSSAGGGGATVIAFNSNSASSGFLIIGGGGGVAGVGSGTPAYQVGSGGDAGKGTLPAYNASTTTPTFFNGSNSKSFNGTAMADMARGAGQGGTSTSGGAGQNGANAYSGNGGLLSGGTLGAGGGSGYNNSGWCGGGGGGGYSGGSGGSTASNDPGWGGIYFAGGGGGGCTAGMNMFTTNVDGTSESWSGGGGYAYATW